MRKVLRIREKGKVKLDQEEQEAHSFRPVQGFELIRSREFTQADG